MRQHWRAGLRVTRLTLTHPRFFAPPDRHQGFAVHDVHRLASR